MDKENEVPARYFTRIIRSAATKVVAADHNARSVVGQRTRLDHLREARRAAGAIEDAGNLLRRYFDDVIAEVSE